MWKQSAVSFALAALLTGGTVERVSAQTAVAAREEKQPMATQSKFYCNSKALNPAERAHHKQSTDKLVAERKRIVETEKGYEFEYNPSSVTLTELAEWVAAEGKCCPFFDFHIDLEREGTLLCLRLTGEEGIKPFIRSEFQVRAK
jgi:hypothetical protein